MKLTQRRRKASKDFISKMPDNVVATILDRLPLQDAVRTGILSRDWRSKWTTMLSQLVFDQKFFEYVQDKNYQKIISRLLLDLKGPITKFVLYLESECFHITHWILVLSKKGVRDVTIIDRSGNLNKLPTHFFSCLELKHLNLSDCYINPPASFHGFPNLLSLELYCVEFESENFCALFNECPVLESLIMRYTCFSCVKLVELAKLVNLKLLRFSLCYSETMITSTASIFELVSCLPKLEELELDFVECKPFIEDEDDAIKISAITFPCLKTLKLLNIDLSSGIMLSFAFEMIRSSPSLQTLEITADKCSFPEDCAIKRPPTTLPYLKTLKFSKLASGFMLAFAFDIIRSSPNLQTLEITGGDWSSTEDCATERSPTIFPYLKKIKFLNLGGGFMLSFAFDIIRSSPNLQTLEVTAGDWSSTKDCATERSPTTFLYLKTIKFSNLGGNLIMLSAFDIIRSSPNLQTLEVTAGDLSSTEVCATKRSPTTLLYLKTIKISNLGGGFMLSFAFDIIRSSPNLQALVITTGDLSSTVEGTRKRFPITFPYLKTLRLSKLGSGYMLSFAVGIIRSSPNLQTLVIEAGDWSSTEGETRKRSPITLPCLKTLTLSNIDLGDHNMVSFAFELMKSSQNLQTLKIAAGHSCSTEDGARKRSRTTFPCLETLKLHNIDLGSCIMLPLAFELISSSPNLQTLEIRAGEWDVDDPEPVICFPSNKTELLQLRSVVCTDLKASKIEVSLIKYLLASSPFLNKIIIRPNSILKSKDKLMFARKLLKLHRASTTAEIKLY